jgi:DNA-binding NtrC family response regulator
MLRRVERGIALDFSGRTPIGCDKMALSKTLLIVDDEKNTRDGLRDALEDHYEVYVAGDIAGAFAAMETEPADVLITDLRLGAEDGMDLMRAGSRDHERPMARWIRRLRQ